MKKKILLASLLLLIFIGVLGAVVYFLRFSQINGNIFDNSKKSSVESVIEKLGKHILLPSTTPTVGTVTDVEKLREKSAFFKDAKNGDTVVIYSDRAIIYDGKADKIVNVGLIPKNQNTATEASQLDK